MPRSAGWKAFVAWALAGALVVFAFLSGFSIGLFVLPLAGVVLWIVARRTSAWPEVFGVGAGAGALCLLVAFLNRDYTPCPEGPITLAPGQTSFECGGADPVPWLVAGVALVAGSVLAYFLLRRFLPRPPGGLSLSGGETAALVVALVVLAFGLMVVVGGGVVESDGAGGVIVEKDTAEPPPEP
jgi:hypothetical protein